MWLLHFLATLCALQGVVCMIFHFVVTDFHCVPCKICRLSASLIINAQKLCLLCWNYAQCFCLLCSKLCWHSQHNECTHHSSLKWCCYLMRITRLLGSLKCYIRYSTLLTSVLISTCIPTSISFFMTLQLPCRAALCSGVAPLCNVQVRL